MVAKGNERNPDNLGDVRGCRGAAGLRGDGVGAQQHPGVHVTVGVTLSNVHTGGEAVGRRSHDPEDF